MMEVIAGQQFRIREVTPTDIRPILALEYKCFPDPYPMGLLNKLRSMYPDTFLVTESNGGVVGYLLGAVRWRNVGHILAIGVEPTYRRQRIGSTMMKEVLARFRKKGANLVRLEVRKSNLGAQQFYRTLGFADSFEAPYYYGDGESALAMELRLDSSQR